jgi:hypothetical protein
MMEDSSMSGPGASRLQVMAERTIDPQEMPPQYQPAQHQVPPPAARPMALPPNRAAVDPQQLQAHVRLLVSMQAAFRVAALLLSIRLFLLIAVSGMITLAVMAMEQQSAWSLGTLSIYCLLGVGPLVYLERHARLTGSS